MDFKAESLKVLNDPEEWAGSVLPVIRRASSGVKPAQCAIVVANDRTKDGKVRCFEVNMFELETGPLWPQIQDKPQHEYDTFEEMIEAGWEVD